MPKPFRIILYHVADPLAHLKDLSKTSIGFFFREWYSALRKVVPDRFQLIFLSHDAYLINAR